MQDEQLMAGLRAFIVAGRPQFRFTSNADLDELRSRIAVRMQTGARPEEVDDALDIAVLQAVQTLTERRTDSIARAAPIYFATIDRWQDTTYSARQDELLAVFSVSAKGSLGSREPRVIAEVAARFPWPGRSPGPRLPTVLPVFGEFTIGQLRNAWQVVAVGPFSSENIRSTTVPRDRDYEPLVDSLYREFKAAIEERTHGHRPTDNVCLSLRDFEVTGRTLGREDPILQLTFEKTTYFRSRVTNWNLDAAATIDSVRTTQRSAWATGVDLRERPVPQLGNVWGAIFAVVTTDGWVLLPLRGETEVEPRCFGPSVGEEGLWARDVGSDGVLVPDTLAVAGLCEELGVDITPDQVVWLELGVNTVCCRYALVGLVRPALTRDQIQARINGVAKDRWEIREPFWVRFHPESVAAFMTRPGRRFSPYGIASILRALIYEYGWDPCEAAFSAGEVEVVRDPLVM